MVRITPVMKASLPILTLFLFSFLPAAAQSVAVNDEFATRQVLTGTLPLSWSGPTAGLTVDLTDARVACGAGYLDDCEIEGSMWFEWTAPEAGVYVLRGSEPFFTVVLAAPPLSEPQTPALSQVIKRGMSPFDLHVRAGAGQRLWIMLSHEGDPIPGNQASLEISRTTVAPSAKETATVLPGTPTVHINQATEGNGWWRWRAPAAGTWRLRVLLSLDTIAVERADGTKAGDGEHSFTVAAGEDIYVRTYGTGVQGVEFVLEPFVRPQNVSPETAQPLVPVAGGAAEYFFESLPDVHAGTVQPLAWFSWVAPTAGIARFVPSPDYGFTAYRDDNGSLTQIPFGDGGVERPHAPVSAGQRYLISMPYERRYTVRVEYLSGRGSDSFAGAPEVKSGDNLDYFGDSTTEPGEPGLSGPGDRTRWWTYTPAVDGILAPEGYRLNIYTGGSLDALTLVASKLPSIPSSPVNTQAGTVYRIQVFDSPNKQSGLVSFSLGVREKSPHDNFANAAAVTPGLPNMAQETVINLVRLTAEPGEPPAIPGVPAARTAWARWTAGFSGRVMMGSRAYSSDPDKTYLAVWKGTSFSSLERVPVAPTGPWASSAFDVVAGSVYSFQVEAPPVADSFTLLLTRVFAEPGSSDSFATPLPAEGMAGTFLDYSVSTRATFEPGESTEGLPAPPAGYTSGSYWIRWTAPASGVWRFAAPFGWYARTGGPVLTLYRESLAAGRLAVISPTSAGPFFIKVNQGDTINIGNIVVQSQDFALHFMPLLPNISPAVPGIALAEWYGLPSPANLNASYSSDGIPLLLKHALGLDPLRNSLPGGNDPNDSQWPLLTLTPAGEPSLTFRSASPFQLGNGVDLSGELSADLLSWTSAPESAGPAGQRTVFVPANGPKRFLRLKAALR